MARGVAKVDPLTPRDAHQRPLLLPLLPQVTPRSAHRGITLPPFFLNVLNRINLFWG